jgi:hypothetical protein
MMICVCRLLDKLQHRVMADVLSAWALQRSEAQHARASADALLARKQLLSVRQALAAWISTHRATKEQRDVLLRIHRRHQARRLLLRAWHAWLTSSLLDDAQTAGPVTIGHSIFLVRSCLHAWRTHFRRQRCLHMSERRIVAARCQRLLARCMAGWKEWVLEVRLAIRSVVRLCHRYTAKAFAAWRSAVQERDRRNRLVARAHARQQRHCLLSAWRTWRSGVGEVQAPLQDATNVALTGWRRLLKVWP